METGVDGAAVRSGAAGNGIEARPARLAEARNRLVTALELLSDAENDRVTLPVPLYH